MTRFKLCCAALVLACASQASAGLWELFHDDDGAEQVEEREPDRLSCWECWHPLEAPPGKLIFAVPVELDEEDLFADRPEDEDGERGRHGDGAKENECTGSKRGGKKTGDVAPPAPAADDATDGDDADRAEKRCTLDQVCERQAALDKRLSTIEAELKELAAGVRKLANSMDPME